MMPNEEYQRKYTTLTVEIANLLFIADVHRVNYLKQQQMHSEKQAQAADKINERSNLLKEWEKSQWIQKK